MFYRDKVHGITGLKLSEVLNISIKIILNNNRGFVVDNLNHAGNTINDVMPYGAAVEVTAKHSEKEKVKPVIQGSEGIHFFVRGSDNPVQDDMAQSPQQIENRKIRLPARKPGSPEGQVLRIFKTLGELSHEAYQKLSIKREASDDFEYGEMKPCLENLKGFVKKYAEKEYTTYEEKAVFNKVMADCDFLITRKIPYIEGLRFVSKVVTLMDFHLFRHEIRPWLGVDNLEFNGAPKTITINLKWDEYSKSYNEEYLPGASNGRTKLPKLIPLHNRLGSKYEFFFTCYSDTLTINDVYNDKELYLHSTGIFSDKRSIVLPTTLPVSYESYAKIMRFPIWLTAVSCEPSVVDGYIMMPHRNYQHDLTHASERGYLEDFIHANESGAFDNHNVCNTVSAQSCSENKRIYAYNPFVEKSGLIEDLYSDFDKRVKNLTDKWERTICYMLLFSLLHEEQDINLYGYYAYTPPYMLPYCTEEFLAKTARSLEHNIEIDPRVPDDSIQHIDTAHSILKETIETVKRAHNLAEKPPLQE